MSEHSPACDCMDPKRMDDNERKCSGVAVIVTACERYLCEPCTRNEGHTYPRETMGGEPFCHGCQQNVPLTHFRPLVAEETHA